MPDCLVIFGESMVAAKKKVPTHHLKKCKPMKNNDISVFNRFYLLLAFVRLEKPIKTEMKYRKR